MITLPFRTPAEIEASLPVVLEQLARDSLIAYPTETVYGFGGAATPRAVENLRQLKQRDADKPFLLLITDIAQVSGVVWTETARTIADLFWPGPLTMVLPADPHGTLGAVLADDGTIALRQSPHAGVRAIVAARNAPLTSTSANAPRREAALDCEAAAEALRALEADDVLLLDGGRLTDAPPSTIIGFEAGAIVVRREGAVDRTELSNRLRGTGIDVR